MRSPRRRAAGGVPAVRAGPCRATASPPAIAISTGSPAASVPRRTHGTTRPYSKRIRSSWSTSTSPLVQVTRRNRSALSSTSPRREVAHTGPVPLPPVPSGLSCGMGMNSVTVAVPVGERHSVSSTIVSGR